MTLTQDEKNILADWKHCEKYPSMLFSLFPTAESQIKAKLTLSKSTIKEPLSTGLSTDCVDNNRADIDG